MNCPECGRFMALLIAFEADQDVEASAYWWVCNNEPGCWHKEKPIAAPEYNWAWHCETIPLEALLDSPGLRVDYEAMWERLPTSWKRRFTNVL